MDSKAHLYMQIWGGLSMVVGACFVMAAYCVRTRLKGFHVDGSLPVRHISLSSTV